jgi:hypothetical protein
MRMKWTHNLSDDDDDDDDELPPLEANTYRMRPIKLQIGEVLESNSNTNDSNIVGSHNLTNNI